MSSLIVSTVTLSPSSPASSSSSGISVMHGMHQVAHRLTSTGLPLRLARASVVPCGSVTSTAGIACPADARSTLPVNSSAPATSTPSGCAGSALSLSHPARTRANAAVSETKGNRGMSGSNRMWGGRFAEGPSAIMREINASIPFDKALWRQDIAASKAHVAMLGACGIVSSEDAKVIEAGLDAVAAEFERDGVPEDWALEDIHMTVESRLAELIGPAAGRLHTARSRNDQVATDFKLWVRDAIDQADAGLEALQRALVTRAGEHADSIMPGFTHLQTAQPVTLGHHLMAYYEMAGRDRSRFHDARARLNHCPLGSAALAGTGFAIDREMTAQALDFDAPTANSLDAVSDRDFAIEYLTAAAQCSLHLSRLAEEMILWASQPFGFVRLPDALSTGSSIMPQKKNPDAAELVRGHSGRIVGCAEIGRASCRERVESWGVTGA